MMERIEEFTRDGENFIYIDLSGLTTDKELVEVTRVVETVFKKYPLNSVYTITNISNTRFDSEIKDIAVKYMENNKPYVKGGAIIGVDGIKKVLSNEIINNSGREKLLFAFSKEQAVELLMKKETP